MLPARAHQRKLVQSPEPPDSWRQCAVGAANRVDRVDTVDTVNRVDFVDRETTSVSFRLKRAGLGIADAAA